MTSPFMLNWVTAPKSDISDSPREVTLLALDDARSSRCVCAHLSAAVLGFEVDVPHASSAHYK